KTSTVRGRSRRRRKAPAKPPKTSVRQILSPHARDASGILLVVVALLAALGVWFDAAGPVGDLLTWMLRGALGVVAVAFPIIGVYWGTLLLRDTAREDRVRMFIGSSLLGLGLLGIVSLLGGKPGPRDGYDAVSVAGGVLGAVVAHPLTIVISAVGAFIVCIGIGAVGLLIFTGTPIAVASASLRDFFTAADIEEEDEPVRPVVRDEPKRTHHRAAKLREAFGLLELDLDDEETVIVPDQDLDERDEPAPAPLPTGLTRTIETTTGRGPTVTMYEVEVASGTKVNKVLQLASDIAYALATPDVRIQAPIPGKSAIGIEVPNKHRDFVMLGDILRSKAAKEATHPLEVALGKDIHGRARMVNLASMPHLLIAGATGAGKSSLVNSFITSLLARTTPEDVRLVLVDPKRFELSHFADVPHLLSPVIVHPKRAAEALGWIVREMEQRYELLATAAVRDIDGYEEGLRTGTLRVPLGLEHRFGHLPFIVVVIDELADLMMVAPRAVEDAICRIAQMARAVGIHLVVATQRPSVDVVTGLIKANIPSRIALMTSSQADSRVILDMNGAEKLVGHGDMLFAPSSISKPVRLQGAWVTEQEIRDVADFIRAQREAVYERTVEGLGLPPVEASGEDRGLGSDDDLLEQAAELVIRSRLGSTSMLQRKLKVGFARAGRLMDLMEDQGIVGPGQGSKARDVLVTWEEWEERASA
ncbi:MAG: DNA translocase FtsK, partial [Actinobacteria bacterium]